MTLLIFLLYGMIIAIYFPRQVTINGNIRMRRETISYLQPFWNAVKERLIPILLRQICILYM